MPNKLPNPVVLLSEISLSQLSDNQLYMYRMTLFVSQLIESDKTVNSTGAICFLTAARFNYMISILLIRLLHYFCFV